MTRLLTSLIFCLPFLTAAAQCPTPDLVQVVKTQRAALAFIAGLDATVDSLQVLLGDEFFLDAGRDRADTVITFTDALDRRGFILYDLEPGRRYRLIAQTFCNGQAGPTSGRGELFTTDPSGPPDNDNIGGAYILAGGAAACGYLPATTREATASTGYGSACQGTADDDVWFSLRGFFENYGVSFRPTGGTDEDLVVEIYDAGRQLLACVDAGGPGDPETYELYGLPEGDDRYFRVFSKGGTGYTRFEYCNFSLDPLPVATGTGCIAATPVIVDGSGSPGHWIDIVDDQGSLVASIENTQPLGEVNASFYGHAGPLRTSGTTRARYASRNVSIEPAMQPTDTIGVRLYLTAAEVNQLIAAGAITGVGELDVTRVPAAICSTSFPGGGAPVTFRRAGPYGSGYYVEIGVAAFSDFFVHPSTESLRSTTAVRQNGWGEAVWGVAPNPVGDHLTLTAPPSLRANPVTAEVYDGMGRLILHRTLPPGHRRALSARDWVPGLYVLVLSGEGWRTSLRLIR